MQLGWPAAGCVAHSTMLTNPLVPKLYPDKAPHILVIPAKPAPYMSRDTLFFCTPLSQP